MNSLISNDEPAHRQLLIDALKAEGMDAYEYHSGGGCMHVCVDLINETGEAGAENLLQIASGSVDSSCDVCLMGWNESGNVQNGNLIRALTFKDAMNAFKKYWSEQDVWIKLFEQGNLDT